MVLHSGGLPLCFSLGNSFHFNFTAQFHCIAQKRNYWGHGVNGAQAFPAVALEGEIEKAA
jgi:hypothetical protein